MDITVVGCGHVGLVVAACFAKLGHSVVGVDDDAEKIALLQAGACPIYEPGLAEALSEVAADGRLTFTRDLAFAVEHGRVIFICVGTPPKATGDANLVYVERVAEGIARHAPRGHRLVVEKSTVPVQTGERLQAVLGRNARPGARLEVASNPEFLREGTAMRDFMEPDRIVVGVSGPRAAQILQELHEPIIRATGCPYIVTDIRTAEIIKHACNAFLATKLSFINALANVCELAGSDIEAVEFAMGCDPRIGTSYLRAGAGYGGACLPKDVDAFVRICRELGYDFRLLEEVARINGDQRRAVVDKIRRELWNLEGKQIGVLGMAFKAETDDVRNSPALDVIEELLAEGAKVRAYDPAVTIDAEPDMDADLVACSSVEQAFDGSHAIAIMTDWPEFRQIDWERARDLMADPVVVDGRNMLAPKEMSASGFTYLSVGRPEARPAVIKLQDALGL